MDESGLSPALSWYVEGLSQRSGLEIPIFTAIRAAKRRSFGLLAKANILLWKCKIREKEFRPKDWLKYSFMVAALGFEVCANVFGNSTEN